MNKAFLTTDEIKEKAAQLESLYNCKVHPLVFMVNDGAEQIVGYMKEPPRFVKLRVLDQSMTKPMTAAAECLEAILIKEHSDPRIYSESPECDEINLGATVAASNIITFSANQFKKK